MCRLLSALLFLLPLTSAAQGLQIPRGAAVYIEPMDGYETYLAAAFAKKHVPVVLVADSKMADFIVKSTVSQQGSSQPVVVVNNNDSSNNAFGAGMQASQRRANMGATSASIAVVDVRSLQIVFAYAVGKSGETNQVQSAAEASAKHLAKFIEKPSK